MNLEYYVARNWSLKSLNLPGQLGEQLQLSTRCRNTDFPIRALRYWFVAHAIVEFANRAKQQLSVNEIGINAGEMRRFYNHHCQVEELTDGVVHWDGLDLDVSRAPRELYSSLTIHDLNNDQPFPKVGYDVVVLLHVLEHLPNPEHAFSRVCETLAPGGIVIGGFPSTPHLLIRFWQNKIRKRASPSGHVSCFSRKRAEALAHRAGLEICFMGCGFVLRHSGSLLENYQWWARWNVLAGTLCKSFPTELVWCFRRPG